MGGSGSKKQASQSEATASAKSNGTSQESLLCNGIRRLAIDQSAVIGSLYNARTDRFLESPSLKISSTSNKSPETPYCTVINGDELQFKKLLDRIGVDENLCLSAKLDMVPQNELSSIINYSLTTDVLARILFYNYVSEEKYISDGQNILNSNVAETMRNVAATHFITRIKSGVLVVVVLELLSKDESYLNSVLNKISRELPEDTFKLSGHEKRLLDQVTSTKIFSNLPELCKLTKLVDVCQKIIEIKPSMSQHRLLDYTLRPIEWPASLNSAEKYKYFPLISQTINKIEQHLIQLSFIIKSLRAPLAPEVRKSLNEHFKNQFNEVQQQILNETEIYKSRVKEIRNLVYKMRSGASQEETIADMQIEKYQKSLQNKIVAVNDKLIILEEKLQLMNSFKEEIEYWNVEQIVEGNDHDLETIKKQLMKKGDRKHIFCFDDKLEKPNSSQWKEFYGKLIDEHKKNPQLELVYADFSFCSCQLPEMMTFSSKDIGKQRKISQEEQSSIAKSSSIKATAPSSKPRSSTSKPTSSTAKPKPPTSPPTPPTSKKIRLEQLNPSTNKSINVLLLGESGVGKSTFINAIVNYLTFDTLEDAHSKKPIALMSVSFLMTVGDHFKEKIVKFGEKDPNEDHNHLGQSVTQHCRSYVFTISTRTKLRLIDTPGMGDTRGLDQDDLNMQHILSYINNLSHLNAICILLKPNEARLNVVFRSYFTRLLGFLGENIRNNIIFCFTNTRGTFFAPGNTGPLLKKMLNSHSIKDIPFKKTNTFCFDSESFRYLVARLDGIEFDDYQKERYKQSWMTSVKESNRLLEYICSELKPYPQTDWQSIEHAQFRITQMIRPMLETLRYILRNSILQQEKPSKSLIKLLPKELSRPSTICIACKGTPQCFSDFLVLPDDLHHFSDNCDNCKCSRERHIDVDCRLDYELIDDAKRQSTEEMKLNLNQFKQAIVDFGYFFVYTTRTSKPNDPVLSSLNQMIEEEHQLCEEKSTKCLNLKLLEKLNELKEEYEQQQQQQQRISRSNKNSISLTSIYELIQVVNEMEPIKEQMHVIKQYQEKYMSKQETQNYPRSLCNSN